MEETMSENCNKPEKNKFICGVIEGFYGRPWTTEQRKDLFRKLKKWGMDSYVYAPKDDYKHRAYWRELYTVEEADHLTSLITAAKEHDIVFYYALSPGLDMTYSSQKEIHTLKRKLDQVSQFGCEAFALLFDDIESELSKIDKEVFQTFGNAQVSVTNEIFTHLGNPKFLFCPTQYCSSRAVPTVDDSEYLNTLGSKLHNDIDIMWTGNKVISKTITVDAIQEISQVLRRPPVIWDNLHANDYDQKRVFLGPYSGRSPELIPHLRGVMTNPNCEFHANTIAIHSLASWSKCNLDTKVNHSLSADIKLETENEDGSCNEDVPSNCCLAKNIYHPRMALRTAIAEWLPEFYLEKEAWGPITKPQPQVTMVMPIIPIIPSINTCMSLTTMTTTSTNSKTTVPEVNTTQLQALAEVCSTVNSSTVNPIANPIMNSLISATKVVTNDDILNPITPIAATNIELPRTMPISSVAIPIIHAKSIDNLGEESLISTAKDEKSTESNNLDKSSPELENNSGIVNIQEEKNGPKENSEIKNIEEQSELFTDKVDNLTNSKSIEGTSETTVSVEEEENSPVEATGLSNESCNMLDDHNLSPLSTGNEPMECSSSLASQISPREFGKQPSEDVIMSETISVNECNTNSMQVESLESSPISNSDMKEDEEKASDTTDFSTPNTDAISEEDLNLMCDLFYLPFEHGTRGSKFLVEFNWLKANATVLLNREPSTKNLNNVTPKPEVAEWMQRADRFNSSCQTVQELLKKIAQCANKEICHDLFSYVWDIAGTLMLLNAFVKWLSLGRFPQNSFTFTQGSYTWFSKGWKETFMSGDQEPWVFRGGLTADLQRLMPVDSGNDLFIYKLPELPTSDYHILRPYLPTDEEDMNKVCTRTFIYLTEPTFGPDSFPDTVKELISDNFVGPFVTLSPEFCIVAQHCGNEKTLVGFSCAALNINNYIKNLELCWIPHVCEKYPMTLLNDSDDATIINSKKLNDILCAMIRSFHSFKYECPPEVSNSYPAVLYAAVLNESMLLDQGLAKRMVTVNLATLRANGCFGAHVRIDIKNGMEQMDFYAKLGFIEVYRDPVSSYLYLGRRF